MNSANRAQHVGSMLANMLARFAASLTHDLFHNELFLVFCSTLAGTAHNLTAHMALVGKNNFFSRLSMVPLSKIGKKVILFLPANGSLQLIK